MIIYGERWFRTAVLVTVLLVCLQVVYYTHRSTTWKDATQPAQVSANNVQRQLVVPDRHVQATTGNFQPGGKTKVDKTELKPNLTYPVHLTPHPVPPKVGCMDLESLDKDKALVLGHRKKDKGFLTIGITSAKRQNVSYLRQTLKSCIDSASEYEQSQLTIIVFACDFEEGDRQEARDIVSSFPEHVQSGLLQLIEAPRSFYPPLTNLKMTFNDQTARVIWRSKENVDVVFLLAYSVGFSNYYMLLDDDFTTRSGYVRVIRDFIAKHRGDQWTMLDISEKGTGKLFRDENLLHIGRYLVAFYQEQPVDYLLNSRVTLSGQKDRFTVVPPLFKHLGRVSTLALKNKPR